MESTKVMYEGVKGVKVTLADPTNTILVGSSVNVDTAPKSARALGISQNTIIAAQWMLLYCRNVQRKDSPGTPYLGKLTTIYARDNVRDADSVLALVSYLPVPVTSIKQRSEKLNYFIILTTMKDPPSRALTILLQLQVFGHPPTGQGCSWHRGTCVEV